MTEAVFSSDSYCSSFDAEVLACWEDNRRFRVILDKTAFFPEQGGQYADTGTLGDAAVLDVQISEGEITHFTDKPLTPHATVHGIIDWGKRYSRMQNHTGEHLVSGLIHTLYGYENVGFHLNDTEMTLDTSGFLTKEQMKLIETMANAAVSENLPVSVSFPTPEELRTLSYRSKLDLFENVRIVTIPGYDVCACCAPHVRRTGEIGMIKLLDAIRYKGGMRIHLKCGNRALDDYRARYEATVTIANALHIRQEEVTEGVMRLMEQISAQKTEINTLKRDLLALRTEAMTYTDGNLCFIEGAADIQTLRAFVNAGVEKCGGICGAFSGDDREGYLFVIGSKDLPLRGRTKEITQALDGRGGGTDRMISGSCSASAEKIREFIAGFR